VNDQYAEIKAELELTKQELELHLLKSFDVEMASEYVFGLGLTKKQTFMFHTIQEDLIDVNRALLKMNLRLYGICEETGNQIPIEKLKIIPTARTIYDFP
jgi:DnaK suppressor protein